MYIIRSGKGGSPAETYVPPVSESIIIIASLPILQHSGGAGGFVDDPYDEGDD